MNSYQLIFKLIKVRADTYLTPADQALFHELVAQCNELRWKEVFFVRSNVLCGNLNMSDNTLRKSRKTLADANLLFFETSRDKRIGCFYSFVQKLSNDVAAPAISSAVSSAIFEDDPQVTPIIDNIKTINEESHAHTREAPPPGKPRPSRKKEADAPPLEYPFTSIRFLSAWKALRQTPKWKNKLSYALQLSLNKLGKFEEEFAIEQMERAAESNWTGVVFPETEEKYQEWLKQKYGNNRNVNDPSKDGNGGSEPPAVGFKIIKF